MLSNVISFVIVEFFINKQQKQQQTGSYYLQANLVAWLPGC